MVSCRGGLNEEASDLDVSAGEVRRSLNYEQVAAGGYRRIGGSVRWGGSPNTPDMTRVSVVETTRINNLEIGEATIYDNGILTLTAQASLTEYDALFVIGRGSTDLWVVEKKEPTSYFVIGEAFYENSTGTVLAENPELKDDESDRIIELLDSFGRNVAVQATGAGPIEFMHGLKDQLVVGRRTPTGVQFQISTIFGRAGNFLEISTETPIPAGAVYDSYRYQFAGGLESIYIATGVSNPYIYRYPLTLTELTVGDITAFPTHVIVHQNHLFLGYESGHVVHSDLGNPAAFTELGGGSEFWTGSAVTGFQILPGESLAIFGQDQISILSGTSSADWQLDTYSDQVGALPGTIQNMPTTIFASRRGITTLSASDNYGDFSGKTLSHRFDPTYQRITRGSKLFSLVNRDSSQYRLINGQGRCLYLTFSSDSLVGAMEIDLGHDVMAVGVIEGEVDSLFFGTSDGWIYRMDQSSTFGDESLSAFLEFPYYHHKSPRQKKRFKQTNLSLKGDPRARLSIRVTTEKGRLFHADPIEAEVSVIDSVAQRFKPSTLSRFDQTFEAVAYTSGTGTDQSLLVMPANNAQHEIDTITTHYTYRGQRR